MSDDNGKKTLKVYRSLGTAFSVGWARDDAPLIHVFAQAEPGTAFNPSDGRGNPHWPCTICEHHGYTEADFHAQVLEALERGPVGDKR